MLHSEASSIGGGLELTEKTNTICLYFAQTRYSIGIFTWER